jgi:hypothetical protein
MAPYPKFLWFVRQVFSLTGRRIRPENLHLLAGGWLRAVGGCPALAGPRAARVGCRLPASLAGEGHPLQPSGARLDCRHPKSPARGASSDGPGVDRRLRLCPAGSLRVFGGCGGGLRPLGQRWGQDGLEGAEPLAL